MTVPQPPAARAPRLVSLLATVLAATGVLGAAVPAALAQTAGQAPATGAGAGADPGDGPVATGLARPSAPLTYAEVSGTVRPWIERLASVRAVLPVSGDESLLRVIADRDYTISLATLHTRLNTPGASRTEEYGSFMGALERTLKANDPFQPQALRTIIRPTTTIDDFELMTTVNGDRNRVVRRAFAPGLEEVVVADTRTSIAYMPVRRLEDLSLSAEDAFTLGRTNLADVARAAVWSEEEGLRTATLDGVFEPSLLAVTDLWDQLEADMGGPVAVAIPRRGRILVALRSSPPQMARLRSLATAEAAGDGAISARLLVRSETGWQPLD
jgi:hypothetical protein